MRALVLTVSNRAAAGVYADTAGPILVAGLSQIGFEVAEPRVVPDGEPVRQALREAVAGAYDIVLTTGGTGLTPLDRTPEMTRSVLDYEVPGIPEQLRAYGVAQGVPSAVLSRGVAGVAGQTLIVNFPGSPKAIGEAGEAIAEALPHALRLLRGEAGH